MFYSILVSCLYIYKTFLDVIFIIQMAKVYIKVLFFRTSLNNLNFTLIERVSEFVLCVLLHGRSYTQAETCPPQQNSSF